MRSTLRAAVALTLTFGLAAAGSASAQTPDTVSGPVLTLQEAQSLAARNNPEHLQVINNRGTAAAALRAAYGNLLPSADASFSTSYRQQGEQPIQGVRL